MAGEGVPALAKCRNFSALPAGEIVCQGVGERIEGINFGFDGNLKAKPPAGPGGDRPDGGDDGAVGLQRVERADGRTETLEGRAQTELEAGDAIVIETPGGGGYGDQRTT